MVVLQEPRVPLAHLPTPVEAAPRLLPVLLGRRTELPALFVKRDDLTGAELSGNKVRKLEFLLGAARAQGADTVITCGGVQSNHCRATALAAARLGLRSILCLRTPDPPPPVEGNILLGRLAGAEVRYVTPEQYRGRAALMADIAAQQAAAGHRAYAIPEGGSNAVGCWGYVACVLELAEQLPPRPATLCYAAGSGGTGAGLLLGVALLGLPWRVVGFNVCDDRAYFVRVIGDILQEVADRYQIPQAAELSRRRAEAIDIRDGYVGRGYALSRPEELALIRDVCRGSGLVLDPVYTGKAFGGLLGELRRDPRGLGDAGDPLVFLHTGGIFGLFPKTAELLPLLA